MLAYLLYWFAALRARLADAAFARHAVGLDDMPGHPERVRPIGDLDADGEFWDAAERLLDDPEEPDLADLCEGLRWMR